MKPGLIYVFRFIVWDPVSFYFKAQIQRSSEIKGFLFGFQKKAVKSTA